MGMYNMISLKSIFRQPMSKETKEKIAEKISYYSKINQEYHNEDGTLDVYRCIGSLSTKISLIEQANEYILKSYCNSYYQGQWVRELKELCDLKKKALQTVLKMSRALVKKGILHGIYTPEKECSNEETCN